MSYFASYETLRGRYIGAAGRGVFRETSKVSREIQETT